MAHRGYRHDHLCAVLLRRFVVDDRSELCILYSPVGKGNMLSKGVR